MEKILNKFNESMTNEEFVESIIQLDDIDNISLCEYDEEILLHFYNDLYKTCYKQINDNLSSNISLNNRTESFGDFMYFLKHIGL